MKDALKGFPRFLLGHATGLTISILTEIETFLVFLVALTIGLNTSLLTGLSVFFGIYVALRMGSQWVTLIASKLHQLAEVMYEMRKTSDE
jgi:hypothetical protein